MLKGEYLCFSEKHDEEKAKKTFEEIQGRLPERVIVRKGLLKVGPIDPADVGESQETSQTNLS